jgi:predicted transcriptional regulator
MKKVEEQITDSCGRKLDEITKQEIVYRDYVKRKIEKGIKAAEEGRFVSHDQVKMLFAR